jgi:hypothetical protein
MTMPQVQAEYPDPDAERIAAQRALLAQAVAPRFTPEQQEQRMQQNERLQALGMLGVLSGSRGAGRLGGSVLQNAQALAQPHTTERGSYDPITGDFAENPGYTRQRQEADLARMQEAQAHGRQAWLQARQAAQERADAAETQRQFLATQNAATRSAAGAGRAAAQDARNWTVEDRMADDFNRDTKTQQSVLGAHKNLQAIAQKTDAPSDVAFIYSYMKMLDPGSVVREGEFATAQNAAGVPDRIRNAYNATMSGQRLNQQQRAEMLGTAARLAAQAENSIGGTAQQYADKAQRRQLNPENITGRPSNFPRAMAAQGKGAAQQQQPQQQPQQPARYRVDF